jgi:hypothetical protein
VHRRDSYRPEKANQTHHSCICSQLDIETTNFLEPIPSLQKKKTQVSMRVKSSWNEVLAATYQRQFPGLSSKCSSLTKQMFLHNRPRKSALAALVSVSIWWVLEKKQKRRSDTNLVLKCSSVVEFFDYLFWKFLPLGEVSFCLFFAQWLWEI